MCTGTHRAFFLVCRENEKEETLTNNGIITVISHD